MPAGAVVGIALAIICALFLIQRFGTRLVGMAFSPIILIWLVSLLAWSSVTARNK